VLQGARLKEAPYLYSLSLILNVIFLNKVNAFSERFQVAVHLPGSLGLKKIFARQQVLLVHSGMVWLYLFDASSHMVKFLPLLLLYGLSLIL
jgi:hypothetical protein